MKAHQLPQGVSLVSLQLAGLLLCSPCVSSAASKKEKVHDPPVPADIRFQVGFVAFAPDERPAAVAYETGKSIVETSGERASRYADATINSMTGQPEANMVWGPVTVVAAPIAAGIGALTPNRSLPRNQLALAERDLVRALEQSAEQKLYRDCFTKIASESGTHNLLFPIGPVPPAADTQLQTRIDKLSLEPVGKSRSNFALTIVQRTRLTRSSDGAVLYEGIRTYHSDPAPYLDWTRHQGLQSVAETGYRKLAKQTYEALLSVGDAPLLTGPGEKHPTKKSGPTSFAHANIPALDVQPASFRPVAMNDGMDAMGVVSFAPQGHIGYTLPKDRDESMAEAIDTTENQIDHLNLHPNPAVAAAAGVIAIPFSLWNQAVAMVGSMSRNNLEKADTTLRAAALASVPERDLAMVVAQQLTPQTAQPVLLVNNPPSGRQTLPPKVKTVLEIKVTSSLLVMVNNTGTRSALAVEAIATMRDQSNGRILYSCPVNYRSAPRHFTDWAKSDASIFKQELKTCYATMSQALTDQLISKGLIPGGQVQATVLARN